MTTLPGRDGIFLWTDDSGQVYLLAGEAKVRPDANDGLRAAQSDMNSFWQGQDIDHEVLLASNHMRDELTNENYDLYEMYFVDDSAEHQQLQYKNIIFVGYSCSGFQSLVQGSITLDDFAAVTIQSLERCFTNQASLIAACAQDSIYCFLPFENVDDARHVFADHNGLII